MSSTSSGPAIEVRGVTKRFGAVTALDAITLNVGAPGTGLLGANGAGKSTLIRCVLGLIRPDEGEVRVLGADPFAHGDDIRWRIGYMPDHDCLPSGMSARDFVVQLAELRGLPRRVAAVRASEVLFQVGLEEERSRLIGTFSLGMKQRTKLAQALVHSPELVLLDEPTSGLDPSGRNEMIALIRRISSDLDVRVLMSSHVLEDVRRSCDEVLVVGAGKLTGVEAVTEMNRTDGTSVIVRVGGDVMRVRSLLDERGIATSAPDDTSPGTFQVDDADPATLDAIRDAIAEAQASLRELRPAGRSLEEAVVEAMG
jgi:ABC-2 type transport system ATP-binding protein